MPPIDDLPNEMLAMVADELGSIDLDRLSQTSKSLRYKVSPYLHKRYYKTLTLQADSECDKTDWKSFALLRSVLRNPELVNWIQEIVVEQKSGLGVLEETPESLLDEGDWYLLSGHLQKISATAHEHWLDNLRQGKVYHILAFLFSLMESALTVWQNNAALHPLFWCATAKYPDLFMLLNRCLPFLTIEALFVEAETSGFFEAAYHLEDVNFLTIRHSHDAIDWLEVVLTSRAEIEHLSYIFFVNEHQRAELDGAKLRKVLDIGSDYLEMLTIGISTIPNRHKPSPTWLRSPLGSLKGFNKLEYLVISPFVVCGWDEPGSLEIVDILPANLNYLQLDYFSNDELSYSWTPQAFLKKLTHFLQHWKSCTPQLYTLFINSEAFTSSYMESVIAQVKDMVVDSGMTLMYLKGSVVETLTLQKINALGH